MKIAVASGKGGVGKTMIASSLALLFSKEKKVVAADCDVDAANLGLWLGVTKYDKERKISTSEKAVIDLKKCTGCGKCFEVCRYNAIDKKEKKFQVNPLLCDGCNACPLVCPENAIKLEKVYNGLIQINNSSLKFPLVAGKLLPGERCSGKIVTEVRREAEKFPFDVMVLDSSPGIGCAVNASITNTDYVMLVTEPTPSGLSDLMRAAELVEKFRINYGIILNKWDINREFSKKIIKWSGNNFLGKISYDRKVVDSIVQLKPVIESNSIVAAEIKEIFKNKFQII